jgi:hypothetical protein
VFSIHTGRRWGKKVYRRKYLLREKHRRDIACGARNVIDMGSERWYFAGMAVGLSTTLKRGWGILSPG